jgi:hypothetical protein
VLFLGIVILGVIEAVQPHFFLTSDNLSQLFPVWTEAGRHLLRGESPWVSQYLYGGGYPLYKDPTFLSCLHPVVLLLSLLAGTQLRFFIVDLFAGLQLLGSCAAMVFLLHVMTRRGLVRLEPWQRTALSLSYGFSGFNLVTASFWFFYVANQVALPLYFTGFLLEKRRHGIALIALAGIHAFLSGVPSSYLFTVLACSAVVLVQAVAMRDVEALVRWLAGQLLAGLVLAPVLWFSIQGFLESNRGQGTAVLGPDMFNVPFLTVVCGWFFAGVGGAAGPSFSLINTGKGLSCTLFAAACAWWLVPCTAAAWRARRVSGWSLAALAGAAVALLLVSRPVWLEQLVHGLPFFRATRWPFRETFLLVFFLHLWISFYAGAVARAWLVRTLIPGTVLLAASLLAFEPAAFRQHATDRSLLFSGAAERHWNTYRKEAPPGTMIIPVLDPRMMAEREGEIPLSLLGANNYPALFEIRSVTGYSSTPPRSALPFADRYAHPAGYVPPDAAAVLWREAKGPATEVRIQSLDPIRIVIEEKTGRISTLWMKPPARD